MAIECAYSFKDLFIAAHHVEPNDNELLSLYDLPQQERNEIVRKWAEQAGWETKERMGTDGKMYLAFAPEFGKA